MDVHFGFVCKKIKHKTATATATVNKTKESEVDSIVWTWQWQCDTKWEEKKTKQTDIEETFNGNFCNTNIWKSSPTAEVHTYTKIHGEEEEEEKTLRKCLIQIQIKWARSILLMRSMAATYSIGINSNLKWIKTAGNGFLFDWNAVGMLWVMIVCKFI